MSASHRLAGSTAKAPPLVKRCALAAPPGVDRTMYILSIFGTECCESAVNNPPKKPRVHYIEQSPQTADAFSDDDEQCR